MLNRSLKAVEKCLDGGIRELMSGELAVNLFLHHFFVFDHLQLMLSFLRDNHFDVFLVLHYDIWSLFALPLLFPY